MDDMDVQTVPLSAVPILLQILSSPEHPNRDETLTLLCDLVASSYGEDGDALGATVREAGGLLTLSWLLAEPEPEVQKQTLFLIANLASDAVDPRSYLSKRLLRQCGCEYRLLPCLDGDDAEVVTYACAALQNLCHDPEWSQVLLDEGVVSRLEELVNDPNDLVQRYAAGALKNLMAALAEAGFDATTAAPIVSDDALLKVQERAKWAAVQRISERSASRLIQRAWMKRAEYRRELARIRRAEEERQRRAREEEEARLYREEQARRAAEEAAQAEAAERARAAEAKARAEAERIANEREARKAAERAAALEKAMEEAARQTLASTSDFL